MTRQPRLPEEPHIRGGYGGDAERSRAPDHWRIDVDEEWSLRFWTRELGCGTEALRHAVRMAGSSAGAVRDYLRAG